MAVGISLLGCTGSVGRSALSVIERHRDEFRIVALAAHRNGRELESIARRHRASMVVLTDADGVDGCTPDMAREVRVGERALLDAALSPARPSLRF
jgi:1-deoxy-D-xylulose-5-phosphate reductoisomerase